jgi:hypothetical protein
MVKVRRLSRNSGRGGTLRHLESRAAIKIPAGWTRRGPTPREESGDRGLEQTLCREHAVIRVLREAVGPGQPHAGLPGLVEHCVAPVEQRGQIRLTDVVLDEG